MKYSDKERIELMEKHWVGKEKYINLAPYIFVFKNHDESKEITSNDFEYDDIEKDGEYYYFYNYTEPSFEIIYNNVQKVIKEYNISLKNINWSLGSHGYPEGWDSDEPMTTLSIYAMVPKSIEEIESDIDEKIEKDRQWKLSLEKQKEDKARKKELEERKLLEDLKKRYE